MNYLLTTAANSSTGGLQWYFWTGIIAAICITIFCIPALINIVKTKDTSGVSIVMYIVYVLGCLFFLITGLGTTIGLPKHNVQGNLSTGLPLCISNGVASIIGIVILSYKCRHLKWAKKYGVTEKDIAKEYYKYLKLAKEEKAKAKARKADAKSKKLDEVNQSKEQVDQTSIG